MTEIERRKLNYLMPALRQNLIDLYGQELATYELIEIGNNLDRVAHEVVETSKLLKEIADEEK